jgi:hypothetical protein
MIMTDDMSRREKWAAADAARAQARWGMSYLPDPKTATPERLAYEARERGDEWFQIDVAISVVQGAVNAVDGFTQTARSDSADFIGPIEAQGWTLQHVSTTYVIRGQSTMATVGGAAEHAFHGELVGLYVFRRRQS